MDIARDFLEYSAKVLEQMAGRIETCVTSLTEDQVWARGSENENAVGNLVLHLCGNVRQWIVAGVGGAPDARERDAEFEARGGASPAELSSRLRATVAEAVAVIQAAGGERLAQRIS